MTYATLKFEHGEWISIGALTSTNYPKAKGFYAKYNPKSMTTPIFVGPFEHRIDAYNSGKAQADFSHVVEAI